MGTSLPSLYAEAWTDPRRSIRRMLGSGLREQDRLLMVVLSLVVFCVPLVILLRSIPQSQTDGALPPAAISIACAVFVGGGILGYYLVSFAIRIIGGLFGGIATVEQCRTVSAWWQFAGGITNACVMLLTFVLPESIGMIMRLIVSFGVLVMLSAFVTEVHGFQSRMKVLMIAFGVMFGIALLLNTAMLSGVPR